MTFIPPNGEGGCYTCGHAVDTEHAAGCPRRSWGDVVKRSQVAWTWTPTAGDEAERIARNLERSPSRGVR